MLAGGDRAALDAAATAIVVDRPLQAPVRSKVSVACVVAGGDRRPAAVPGRRRVAIWVALALAIDHVSVYGGFQGALAFVFLRGCASAGTPVAIRLWRGTQSHETIVHGPAAMSRPQPRRSRRPRSSPWTPC